MKLDVRQLRTPSRQQSQPLVGDLGTLAHEQLSDAGAVSSAILILAAAAAYAQPSQNAPDSHVAAHPFAAQRDGSPQRRVPGNVVPASTNPRHGAQLVGAERREHPHQNVIGDSVEIVALWLRLLVLAGRQSSGGRRPSGRTCGDQSMITCTHEHVTGLFLE